MNTDPFLAEIEATRAQISSRWQAAPESMEADLAAALAAHPGPVFEPRATPPPIPHDFYTSPGWTALDADVSEAESAYPSAAPGFGSASVREE